MKTLYLIRHAKSSWDDKDLTDFERPLNKRGNRDAPFMALLLKEEKVVPDLIISSPALRAISTAQIFADKFDYPKNKILLEKSIYLSGIKELEAIVQSIPDSHNIVFVFGHNPSITHYANHLGNKFITNIPTCGIVGIGFYEKNWHKVEMGKGKTFRLEFPKKYFK
ncbi:MAG: histidine phosphatase family protein [Bacteroidota bacterium]